MKNIISISVGIPAYNEEANIGKLLSSIISQSEAGFVLQEIIIVSDGSTDKTASIVKNFSNKKVKLIEYNSRFGKSSRLNQILKIFKGDILFLLDADIVIKDNRLFSKIIDNNFNTAGIIAVNSKPTKPINYFQKIMHVGVYISSEIAKRWNGGRNYLSFRGCFLALNKNFAKQIKIDPKIVNNDSYLYFSALDNGYTPKFLENAVVYFNSPKNFSDYIKQTNRFKISKGEMSKFFKSDLDKEYNVPLSLLLSTIIKLLMIKPYFFANYLVVKTWAQIQKPKNVRSTWSIASSTK